MYDTPILFLIFNRPIQTEIVFAKIKMVKPKFLYIAADGARTHREGEIELCNMTRDIVLKNIDWDCEVKTLFRQENLGCGLAVSSAIDWFFQHVEMGIILEDDCVPNISFFSFCKKMLEKYKGDTRIMQIAGTNVAEKWKANEYDYFYSKFGGIWGWATWRRAWNKYDFNIPTWNTPQVKDSIKYCFTNNETYTTRVKLYDDLHSKKIDTWDYQWTFSKLINNGLSIVPSFNLISNIGFNNTATHTLDEKSPWSRLNTFEINTEIKDNEIMIPDRDYDSFFENIRNKGTILSKIAIKIVSLYKFLKKWK